MKQKKTATSDAAPSFIEGVTVSDKTLETIREQLRAARDIEQRLGDLASVVSEENKNLHHLKFEVLPDLFAGAGIDNLGLPPEGNNPAYDAKLRPYYRANIAASWPEEKRAEAFAALEKLGGADIIKTTITVYLGREQRKLAQTVAAALKKLKVEFEVESDVPHSSLTAFVREQIEKRKRVLPLDKIGATVGMIVDMKERKVK